MKKALILTLLSATLFSVSAQSGVVLEKPAVDRRVELLSIVFRLAGRSEYSDRSFGPYVERIDSHFATHKEHELISFARTLPLGYDAPMGMAVALNEQLELATDDLGDVRWSRENARKFVRLLREFAAESDFDTFFASNAEVYARAVESFQPVYEAINKDWYPAFYGKAPDERFHIVLAMGNGMGNYGLHSTSPDGSRNVYAILAAAGYEQGLPNYPVARLLPVMIHEFNHSFVNGLMDKNLSEWEVVGKKLFAQVAEVMRAQAYGDWQTMMNEALVRAAVINYFKDNGGSQQMLDQQIASEKQRGFFWIEQLVAELEKYDSRRDAFPTLESYMPQLLAFYQNEADGWIGELQQQIEQRRPKVVSIAEFENGSTEVDPALGTITIIFDRPLSGQGYSIYNGSGAFPRTEGVAYTNENRHVVMQVALEPDTEYGFVLKGTRFRSVEGVGMRDYSVTFKTRK
jgi:hypothetical protein